MIWTNSIRRVKFALVGTAVVIAATSLLISHRLIHDLKAEEVAKMEVWAEAMRSLMSADETTDLNLVLKVINSNNTIPLLVLDSHGRVTTCRNLPINARTEADSLSRVADIAQAMQHDAHRMKMWLTPDADAGIARGDYLLIYYRESVMLRRLTAFPYVQLGVVSLFIAIAIFALLSSKRAEQNKVWVGLSKETAHQLGTPISSLMAWTEVLKETYPDDPLLREMQTDVQRLEMIAERFSKIGSAPELKLLPILPLIDKAIGYVRRRVSAQVSITCTEAPTALSAPLCAPLFEWVIEVICKNAVDAMSGAGSIVLTPFRCGDRVVVEIADTGKGIARKDFKTVFRPGYTTKQRGWGLGLSLAKRIVEEYHHGRIYVKASEPGQGTTFRIELPAAQT